MNLIAAIFRQSPQQLTPSLGEIVPGLLQAVKRDDEELREGCLQVAYMRLERSGFHSTLQGFGNFTPEVAWRSNSIRRCHGADRNIVHQIRPCKSDLNLFRGAVLIFTKNYAGEDNGEDEEMADADDEDDDGELDQFVT